MNAKDVLSVLNEQVGSIAAPTYEFTGDSSVEFRFNDRNSAARIMQDLNRLKSFHVSPITITTDTDSSQDRSFSVTVTWKALSDPYSTAIMNDMRFLITKFKMFSV